MRTKESVISYLKDVLHNVQPAYNDFRKGYLEALELALSLIKDIKDIKEK